MKIDIFGVILFLFLIAKHDLLCRRSTLKNFVSKNTVYLHGNAVENICLQFT